MTKNIDKKNKIQIIGVGGLILNIKGEILLTKRIEPLFPQWSGKWGIPGGHVEFGENPVEALHRELKEELGIEVKTLLATPLIASRTLVMQKRIYHGVFLCFPCSIIKGKPKRTSPEHTDLKWFKPAEIDFKQSILLTEEFITAFKKTPLFKKA